MTALRGICDLYHRRNVFLRKDIAMEEAIEKRSADEARLRVKFNALCGQIAQNDILVNPLRQIAEEIQRTERSISAKKAKRVALQDEWRETLTVSMQVLDEPALSYVMELRQCEAELAKIQSEMWPSPGKNPRMRKTGDFLPPEDLALPPRVALARSARAAARWLRTYALPMFATVLFFLTLDLAERLVATSIAVCLTTLFVLWTS